MPTEVLIMCPVCGRPQPVARVCVHCGAAMPDVPRPPGLPAAEDLVPDSARAPPRDLELDLGEGRRLVVGLDLIELRGPGGAVEQVPLAEVRRVRLYRRRPWTVALVSGVVLLLAAVGVPSWSLRAFLVALVPVTGWFLLRRETLSASIERVNGQARQVPLGGRIQSHARGSGAGVTARSRWLELSEELRRRGVDAGP
jgi:hypothetical protein